MNIKFEDETDGTLADDNAVSMRILVGWLCVR
jgi:hypothetical protein